MIGDVPVWCVHDEIINCADLKPNPKNPNMHPDAQIKLLSKIITEQGWRMPITVSKRSGLIVKGHGRFDAAVAAGILQAPVDLQDYESKAVEHADMVADNRLAELAVTDHEKMAELLSELSDIELAGFSAENFESLYSDFNDADKEWDGMPDFEQKDLSSFKLIKVHFKNRDDYDNFSQLIGQKLTEKTKSIWYPEAEILHGEIIIENE